MSIYFVFLRRPQNLSDPRDDPFWEFGSFGSTGCHSTNLLNPSRPMVQERDRLAFVQGGASGLKVVGLAPPVTDVCSFEVGRTGKARVELKWDAEYRPVPYEQAPILANNDGYSDFPGVLGQVHLAQRTTWCGKVGSCFRSRTKPLSAELADQLLAWFDVAGRAVAESYASAVQPADGHWHRHAVRERWTTFEARAAQYAHRRAEG